MASDPVETAIKRVLNDRRIFWMPQELIGNDEWVKLKEDFLKSDRDAAMKIIEQAKENFEAKMKKVTDSKKKQEMEADRYLLERLGYHIQENSSSAKQVLEWLESFGPLRCNLPDMEDFGKVIEGHSRSIVEQFFTYKIKKEKDQRRKQALIALWEVVKELYDRHVEPLEIAFFVRKIDSFTQLVEVLR